MAIVPDILLFPNQIFYHHMSGAPFRVAPHLHDGCEVFFVLDPVLSYFVEDHLYSAKTGDVLITRGDEIHHPIMVDRERYERAFVQFRPEYLREFTGGEELLRPFFDREKGQGNLFNPKPAEQRELLQLRTRMQQAALAGDGFQLVQQTAALVDLLRLIRRLGAERGVNATGTEPVKPTGAVSELIAYINANLASDLSLDTLAERVFLDKSTLCRRFRRELGITVQDFVRNKRVLAARERLLAGASVAEACETAGFNDYANFIRTFTRITGISPGKYGKRRMD